MSIRVRSILVIIAMAVGIIIVAIGGGMSFSLAHLRRTVERDMFSIADVADRLISSEIDLVKANVSTSVWHLIVAPEGRLRQSLEDQVSIYPDILALSVLEAAEGKTGNVYIVDSAGSPPIHAQFLNSEYVRRAFNGESIISSSIHEPERGQLVFYVCVPMPNNRILVATIDGMFFSNFLSDLAIWDSGHIFIDDADGVVLANPRSDWVRNRYNFIDMAQADPQYRNIANVVRRMIRGQTGIDRFSVGGIERYCAYRPISGSKAGWSLGVIAPVNEGPGESLRRGGLIMGLITLMLSVIAAILVSGILEKPYKTISGMVATMEHQETLLHTTNQIAEILLRSDSGHFAGDLRICMGMMAQSVNADRMRIFQNSVEGETVNTTLKYEWLKDAQPGQTLSDIFFSYNTHAPNWYAKLSAGHCINSLITDLPDEERTMLIPLNIKSILIVPLFFHDKFWGFVSFDDCKTERIFTLDEEGLMSSGAILVVNALERNDMENDLIRAHEEAVASTEAKSRFLANMSHEMRTPLNAVIGLTELVLGSGRLEKEDEEDLGKIYNSGIILLSLINDILDLSKIESGKFEIIPVEYDIPSLINDTITLNSVRIGSKPITFHLHIDESLPSLLKGDDLRIKQMLNNLLSNAFKYTRQGRVDWTLSCRREGNNVWLTAVIKDTGIGIKPENLEKLFSDYNQVDTMSNRTIEGTGLGLSITRRMAEMMDGSVTAESEYGVGTTFTLTIRQGFVTDVPIGPEIVEKLCNFRFIDHKRDRGVKLIRIPLPYARVLVVDDMSINLDVARGLLKPYKMQVDCVSSGSEAIALIREEKKRYNAVFMDHMMPEMDGIEAVRIIREEIGTEYAKTVPIIALTANAIVGNEAIFLSHGFQAFLTKPIDIRALDAAVHRWVRDKTKETELSVPEAPLLAADPFRGIIQNWTIRGINIEKALANFGNDRESYRDILKSYVLNTPPLLEKIRGCTEEQLKDYAIIVHGIKSASRSIGAEAVGAKAETLELAAKAGNVELVKKINNDFIAEVEQLIAALAALLSSVDAAKPRPLKPAPDPETLAALLEAGKTAEIDGVDKAMESLESYSYESGDELISWLREQVNVMAFDNIVRRLQETLNTPAPD
jgi:signal transduction histidine kinase/CheY-like chemotaxis protein